MRFIILLAAAAQWTVSAQVFDDQSDFVNVLDSSTIVDTSTFIGNTTFGINASLSGAQFFGPDAEVRDDDLILNGQGFHGLETPHVGLNFSNPINAVGVTSNAVDGGRIQLFSGPDGSGTLISETGFGGDSVETFTGVVESTLVASVIFTCDFNFDLRCGLRDPIFGLDEGSIDGDGDGVLDQVDNCTLIANVDQIDTNGDGFGNACDPDINNDGVVNFIDIAQWTPFFNTANSGDVDFNGDGLVNFLDFSILVEFFLMSPGPSALAP